MGASLFLDGSMIPRHEIRRIDERTEPRFASESQIAVLELRRRWSVVRIQNLSESGALGIFSLIPHIGETIRMQLIGRGLVGARICWVRDGKIGNTFTAALE